MPVNIRTIKDIRSYLASELEAMYPPEETGAMSSIIIETLFRIPRVNIHAFPATHVTLKQARQIHDICRELKRGKPLQYILGETNFYNCTIKLTTEVLIPRPETEELVDLVIRENRGFRGSILDIGTGSGCIAIALAVNLPGSAVTGIDNSEGAVSLARKNAVINKAEVTFLNADIKEPRQFP
jgi:release factor glutamine methyltransferase